MCIACEALTSFIDGFSCRAKGGVGVHIITDKGEEHDYAIKLAFKTMNNEIEYEALFFGITIARSLGTEEVEVRVDSSIVVSQV